MEAVQQKFSDPKVTLTGKRRAVVPFTELDTLWVNTGTLCNLTCKNCYIESSPKNDRLAYITLTEVKHYIDDIIKNDLKTKTIGFTGGEPFMNPDFLAMTEYCLSKGFECLVLTNAMQPMKKKQDELLALKNKYSEQLKIRVSLDHYTEVEHEKERGGRSWKFALQGLDWLNSNKFNLSIAGRSLTDESQEDILNGYANFFKVNSLNLNANNIDELVVFPEMEASGDTPEVTTECWSILNKKPTDIMCSNSRMLVKHKGKDKPSVIACTLLPYEEEFDLGSDLKSSFKPISLNHAHCSKFCVLGGGACSL